MSTLHTILAAAAIVGANMPAGAQQPAARHTLVIVMKTPPGAISRVVIPDYPTLQDCRNASAAVLRQKPTAQDGIATVMFCVPVGAVPQ